MKTIDERIVEMRFDNKQFEEGAKQSMSTLEKLKQSLTFRKEAKNFQEIENASKDVSFNELSKNVEDIKSRFSALGIIGVTALQNITNTVLNLSKQLVAGVTIEPVSAGFSKYERMIQSTQTIVNATGKSMDEVEGYLDDLAKYTDETSYDFADMTDNIGKFTSAGVDLGDAVEAMKGIANEAAKSGVGIQGASRAMYNFSQALAMGKVRVTDWMSIENANMATKEFKEQIIQTGIELGTLNEEAKTAKGTLVTWENFRDTLSDDWFTKDVLINTLKKYSDTTTAFGLAAFHAAQEAKTFTDALNAVKDAASTGWMNTYKLIFGNYEEAKVFFTDLANVFSMIVSNSAEARNSIVSDWRAAGGRENLLTGMYNTLRAIRKILLPIQTAFHDLIPPITGERLGKLTEGFLNFSRKIQISGETAEKLYRIFRGLFSILDIGRQGLIAVVKGFKSLLGALLPGVDGVLSLSASIGDVLYTMRQWIVQNGILTKGLQFVGNALGFITGVLARLAGGFGNRVASVIRKITEAFSNAGGLGLAKDVVDDLGSSIQTVFGGLPGFFGTFSSALRTFLSKVLSLDKFSFEGLRQALKETKEEFKAFFSFNEEKLALVKDTFNSFTTNINEGLGRIGAMLENLKNRIASIVTFINYKLKKITAADILVTAGAVGLLSAIGKIADAVSTLAAPLEGISAGILNFGKSLKALKTYLHGLAFKEFGVGFKEFGKGVIEVAGALAILTFLDQKKLQSSAWVLGVLVSALQGVAAAASLFGKLNRFGVSMITLTGSILVMVKAMTMMYEALDAIETEADEARAMVAVGSIIGIMVAIGLFSAALSKYAPNLDITVKAVLAFSAAVLGLVYALGKISKLEMGLKDTAGKLVALVGLLATLVGFAAGLKKIKMRPKDMVGVMFMSMSLNLIIAALDKLAKVEIKAPTKTIANLVMAVGALSGLFFIVRKAAGDIDKAGIGMAGVGVAILAVVGAIKMLENVNGTAILKAIPVFVEFGALLYVMMRASKHAGEFAHKGGLMLIEAAAAITLLAISMKTISSMEWGEIGKGLAAVGAITLMFDSMLYLSKFASGELKTLTKLVGAITALAFIMQILNYVDAEGIIQKAGAIGIVLGSLAVSMKILNGKGPLAISDTAIAWKTIGQLSAILGAVSLCLVILSALPTEGMLEKSTALSEVLLAMAGSMWILGHTPAMSPTVLGYALLALLGVTAVIGALGAIFSEIDALDPSWFDTGAEIMKSVGTGVGNLIGGFVGGIGSTISESLPTIANNVKSFISTIKEGVDMTKGINTDAVLAFVDLAKDVVFLAAQNIFTQEEDFSIFKENITGFAKALVEFSEDMGDVKMENLQTAAEASKYLGEILEAMPRTGGVEQWWSGEIDFVAFSEGLVQFGHAAVEYADTVADLNTSSIKNSIKPVKDLFELCEAVPTSSGIWSVFDGKRSTDMQRFGEGLVDLGKALMSYSKEIEDLDATNVPVSVEALQALMAMEVPTSSGLWSWFSGKKSTDMQRFGEGLTALANALMSFQGQVTDFNYNTVQPALRALLSLTTIGETIPQNVSKYTSFGVAIDNLGKKFRAFVANVSDLSSEKIEKAIENLGKIDQMQEQFDKFKELISDYSGSIAVSFIARIKEYDKELESAGQYMVDGLIIGLRNKIPDLTAAAREIGEVVDREVRKVNRVHSPGKQEIETGQYMGEGYEIGIENKIDDVQNAGHDLGVAANEGIQDGLVEIDDVDVPLANTITDTLISAGKNVSGVMDALGTDAKEVGTKLINTFAGTDAGSFFNFNYDSLTDAGSAVEAWFGDLGEDSGESFVEKIFGKKNEDTLSQNAAGVARVAVRSFSDEISRLDLHQTTADLESQLWTALNPNAKDLEKTMMEMDLTSKKLQYQSQVVNVAKDEYQNALTKYGQTAKETQEAYNKYLQEQIELANLTNTLTELQKSTTANTASTQVAYAKWVAESQDDLLKIGYTMEQIEEAARKATGYDPNTLTQTMTTDAAQATTVAMNSVQTAFTNSAEQVFGSLTMSFGNYGSTYGTAIGDGFLKTFTESSDKINSALDELEVQLNRRISDLQNRFSSVLNSATDGLTITPVLDLSSVKNGAAEINDILGKQTPTTTVQMAQRIAAEVPLRGGVSQTEQVENVVNNYNFEQNNYSPKALSTAEIYRQTQNQYSQFKQRTGGT